MSWTEIDMTSVPTDNELLPEETFFKWELLPGARASQFDANRVEASAKVAEGEFKGRVVYFSYPDPAKQAWSPGVLQRLAKALGEEFAPGETPVDFLNRSAGKQFEAPVKHREITAEGHEGKKHELKIGGVRALRS